jgi:hypothetical protein
MGGADGRESPSPDHSGESPHGWFKGFVDGPRAHAGRAARKAADAPASVAHLPLSAGSHQEYCAFAIQSPSRGVRDAFNRGSI